MATGRWQRAERRDLGRRKSAARLVLRPTNGGRQDCVSSSTAAGRVKRMTAAGLMLKAGLAVAVVLVREPGPTTARDTGVFRQPGQDTLAARGASQSPLADPQR